MKESIRRSEAMFRNSDSDVKCFVCVGFKEVSRVEACLKLQCW